MGFFDRIFRIFKAGGNTVLDKLEDPIMLTEQGIRDMKGDLEKSLEALAQVKALAIRTGNDINTNKDKAEDYERKAMLLLKRAESGDLAAEEADRLAREALVKKEESIQGVARATGEKAKLDANIEQLEGNIKTLKSNISKWENELRTLKARAKVSEATKNLNKQLSQIDSSGTIAMLERMKDKVNEQEALAEAYGDIALENKSLDEDINDALDGAGASADEALAKLKEKLALESGKGGSE